MVSPGTTPLRGREQLPPVIVGVRAARAKMPATGASAESEKLFTIAGSGARFRVAPDQRQAHGAAPAFIAASQDEDEKVRRAAAKVLKKVGAS